MGETAGPTREEGLRRITESLYIVDSLPALYLKEEDMVVVADLHLGYEEAMSKVGVYLPRLQLRKAVKLVEDARNISGARRILVDGDIKHAFDRLLRQERVEVRQFVEGVYDRGYKEMIFVRGNHDNYVSPLLRDLGVELVEDSFTVEDRIAILHGHREAEFRGEYIVMGHEHPAVQVNIGGSKIKFPAMLLVPLKSGPTAIVLPAMGVYQTGNVVTTNRGEYLSPIIREGGLVEEAVPVIIDETIGVLVLPRLGVMSGGG